MTLKEWTDGEILYSNDLNGNFDFVGLVPIGTVLPWLKSYTNTPMLDSKFVECNGQTLSDSESVFDGQVIPNLNNPVDTGLKGQFLRGHTVSGIVETSQNLAHTHTFTHRTAGGTNNPLGPGSGGTGTTTTSSSGGAESRPHNYSVVWIMRVK